MTPDDADEVRTSTNNTDAFELSTVPVGLVSAITLDVRVRRVSGAACTLGMNLKTAGGTSIASAGSTPIPATTSDLTATATGLTLLQSTIDGLYAEFTTNCIGSTMAVTAVRADLTFTDAVPVVPNADHGTSTWSACAANPNMWTCVDEILPDAPDDGTLIGAINPFTVASFDLGTTPVTAHSDLTLRVRASSGGSCPMTYSLYLASGTQLLTATKPLTNTVTNFSTPLTNVALSQSDMDGLYVTLSTGSGCYVYLVSAISLDVAPTPPPAFSGVADNVGICDGTTPVIGIAVNSTYYDTVPCTPLTGAFSADPTFAANDTITAYYDGVSGGVANAGATWTKAAAPSTTPISGVQLNRQRYRTEARDPGTPMTSADIAQWASAQDSDVPLNVTSNLIFSDPAATFEIGTNSFTPTKSMLSGSLWVRSGATFTQGSYEVDLQASGTGACNDTAASIPLCVAGTYSGSSGLTAFVGTGATAIPPLTFGMVQLQSGPFQLGTAPSQTITMASLYVTSATVTTSAQSPTVNISGVLSLSDSAATLSGSGTGTITVGGNVSGPGSINLTGGDFVLRNAGTAQSMNASGTLPGTPWQFNNLRFSTSTTGRTVTIPATSRGFEVANTLQIGKAADTTATYVNASALTTNVRTRDLDITTQGQFALPPALEVDGNINNDRLLIPGTGNLTVGNPAATTTVTGSGSGAPYDITVVAGKTIRLAIAFQVAHNLSLNGTCAAPVTMNSTVPGTARTIDNSVATVTPNYANLQDIAFTNPVTATNSTNLGNNTNITFTGSTGCPAPTNFFEDNTNASSGSANNTTIDGRAAFHMSFVNVTGSTVDRYRTEVSSSMLTSDVTALLPLDGSGADRSATANPASASGGVSWVAGATNFGQAASFNGTSGMVSAPSNAAYNSSTFTVDFWMKASGYGPNPYPSMVTRNLSGQFQFKVGLNASNHSLDGLVTANGGTMYDASTPADPWLDGTWHHVAFTVDASKKLHLYVDGTAYGNTPTYTGTLDLPSTSFAIGGDGASVSYFQGSIDDVQFRTGPPDPAAIAGYAATLRPHAQSIWKDPGYASSGDALSSSCTTGTRCADITYGGGDIRQDGARYYVTHQVRTTSGSWSAAATDWFATSDAISVSAPASVALPSAAPGADALATMSVTTTCTNGSGCALNLIAPSDTVALVDTGGTNTIPRITPAAPTAPGTWAAGSPLGLGFTVVNSTNGKDTARWGASTTFTTPNLAQFNFAGANRTPTLLKTMTNTTEITTIGVRLNAPPTTPTGNYTGTIQLVALDSP